MAADIADLSDNTVIADYDYTVRADGKRTGLSETFENGVSNDYTCTYDSLSRLVAEEIDSSNDTLIPMPILPKSFEVGTNLAFGVIDVQVFMEEMKSPQTQEPGASEDSMTYRTCSVLHLINEGQLIGGQCALVARIVILESCVDGWHMWLQTRPDSVPPVAGM